MTDGPVTGPIALRRRQHAQMAVAGALRDGVVYRPGDPDLADRIERGDFEFYSDRTVEIDGRLLTDVDCGCVVEWRESGIVSVVTRVLRDCGGRSGHLPPVSVVSAEAWERGQSGGGG